MKQRQIDQFFKTLDRKLERGAEVIIVGASAASLMGHVRPSFDIDFEIRLRGRATRKAKNQLEAAIRESAQITGTAVNYSENIAGWSMVNYLDYRKTAKPYKAFGKLSVKIIAPEYWTIGKMTRFLALDIDDMVKILRGKKIKPRTVIRVWIKAVNASDLSLELGQFRQNVIYFLKKYSRKIWGPSVDPAKLIQEFQKGI